MYAPPYQSRLVRNWNQIASLRQGRNTRISASTVRAKACAACPAAPEMPDHPSVALEILIESINDTADLHPFGRFYVGQLLTSLLTNRYRLTTLWNDRPEILKQDLTRPVIILGLPRSGTSFLFNLLSRDPAHRYLSNWETTVSQIPPKRIRSPNADPRRRIGRFLMQFQRYLAPQLEHIHEFYLDGPEECTPLLMQGFDTQALAGMFNVPRYSSWLDSVDHLQTYRHHKRALQTLQATYPGERWLLKSPDHLAALGPILATYPDACLIHLHRDPVQSVSSWASLNAAFRGIYSAEVRNTELGEQVLERLATDMDAYIAARDLQSDDCILDLPYRALISDPIATVGKIYQHFALNLSAPARARMQVFLAADRDKPRSHTYAPEDFGLTPGKIRERFATYMQRFDVGHPRQTE